MMRLRVEHTTTFTYDVPIAEAYTELRLRPLDLGGQRCVSYRLTTEPRGVQVNEFVDHLGTAVGYFDILEPHSRLGVTAVSEVLTAPFEDTAAPTLLERFDYLRPSEPTNEDEPIRAFASAWAGTGTAAQRAEALMKAVAIALIYEKGATSVQTPAHQVLALGRGVCQDFAHLMIAACRYEGIPARYVSGYLFDDAIPEGHGASHAWVDVYDDERGWLSLDPTHLREQDASYVRVAVGRDYDDVPPTRGVYRGNAEETLAVKVSVQVV